MAFQLKRTTNILPFNSLTQFLRLKQDINRQVNLILKGADAAEDSQPVTVTHGAVLHMPGGN